MSARSWRCPAPVRRGGRIVLLCWNLRYCCVVCRGVLQPDGVAIHKWIWCGCVSGSPSWEYIDSGAYFFAAKVDIGDQLADDPEQSMWLEPLQFTYPSEAFSLPIRLGTLNSRGTC